MRKGMSAWTFTCQVRPNWLKSLTYSPPKFDLQGVEDVVHRHVHRLALGAVDIDVQLRRVGAEDGGEADQSGLLVAGCERACRSCACSAVQAFVAAVFEHQS